MSISFLSRNKTSLLISLLAIFVALNVSLGGKAHAQVANPTARAQVSFTFDDGLTNSLTQAAPVLAAYGYTGTNYIIGNCVETVGICPADEAASYMTWAQIHQLETTYGWEIGGHSLTHPLMTEITPTQLENEASQSKAILESHSFAPTAFATPYGDYSDKVIASIAKYYTSHRGFADTGFNVWPNDNYVLRVQQVQAGVSVATVKSYIDQAKANNTWLILVFHGIEVSPSSLPDDYQYSTADLNSIASYVYAQGIPVTNISKGLVTSTTNLLPSVNTATSLTVGWTTNSTARVTVDTNANGNTTGFTDSVKVVADATQSTYLFSPQVAINPNNIYVIKAYLNVVDTFATGEVALYVDEYDSSGSWISGQYKDAVRASYDKELSVAYTPTSINVATSSLQVIVTAGSGITAYVDNVRWFSTTSSAPPVPTPTGTNLMPNSEFDSGIAGGWSTNSPSTIAPDSAGHGATTGAVNSVHFTATTGNTYLFSPLITVVNTDTYTIKSFVNITALSSGEVAFYIDEYNVSGSWISGQYKTAKRTVGSSNVSFAYTPSSVNVAKASFQFIVVGGSGASGYIDAVQWLTPAPITPPVALAPTSSVAPAISGTPQQGSTLTSTTGTWLNTPTSYTYQWQRCTGASCVAISLATGATYNLALADVGSTIRVDVTATNITGSATASSLQTAVVTALPVVVIAPVNSALPTISGTTQVGATLTSTNGTWANSPTSFTYIWQRCTGATCVAIPLATNPTYMLTATDVGSTIRLVVTALNSAGSTSANSLQTAVVTTVPVAPTNKISNGQFDSGISSGWTTDKPTFIMADSASHGAPTGVANSVKLTSPTTGNAHLFSEKVNVSFGTTYAFDCYLNILTITSGEVAFYIDEYDVNGNWISGKYVVESERSVVGAGRVLFAYTPTSASVAKASLQVITMGNSGINAYLDDILWN